MKKKINFNNKNLNILELNKKNKKDKIKILIKVYEKSNDKKYDVYIDMIFDVKSGPMNVTRKKNMRFILHKKKIN
tara:strand:- start:664 stop:888 length:225 start_codon:yes stop_codon:yes gene_type:complete